MNRLLTVANKGLNSSCASGLGIVGTPIAAAFKMARLPVLPSLDAMRNRLLCPFILLLLSIAPGGVQGERQFADEDLSGLAHSLGAYLEARSLGEDTEGATANIADSLEALAQTPGGGAPLRDSLDIGRAFWLSADRDDRKLRPGKIVEAVFRSGSFPGAGLGYAFRVPKGYDPSASSYPLLLTIPDAEEKPAEHLRAHWGSREILDNVILLAPQMPADRAEWDKVQVGGRPGGLSHALSALRLATQRFAIDPEFMFVAGRGKGVPAAVAVGNYSPQRFAGIIGRAGDLGDPVDLGPGNFCNLPTYFMGAGTNATAFQEAHQAAGFDNCRLESVGDESSVWSWMREHARVTFPREVTLVVGQPFPTRAYWLRLAPNASDARATARIDKESNTIRIDSAGVSFVTLYLNDELVNLDQILRVVCNGVESERMNQRSLTDTLDLLVDGTSDAGAVYVSEIVLDALGEDDSTATENASTSPAFVDPQGRKFQSQQAYERFKLRQTPAVAEAMGFTEHKIGWIHPSERSLANKGWIKDWATGQWLSGKDRRRLAKGWVRQDLNWIRPEQADQIKEGLWLVDGEWLSLAQANRRHARIDRMWQIPSPEVLLYSTADRDVSMRAIENMARALVDLRKVFGVEPALPLKVALLRDEEQYDRFAFGDPDGRRLATDFGRTHIIHSAFFAEGWIPSVNGKRTFQGMGATYWDPLVPYGDRYGVHSARLAMGLSFVDALDPSPKTVKRALSNGPAEFSNGDFHEAYEAEKKLPAWLRFGGAVYGERYFLDTNARGETDPFWARQWSLDNLRQRGGLRPLDEVLAFKLDPHNRADGQKLLLEAGLLVSFIVDGACEPVTEAHSAFQQALVSGNLVRDDVERLVEALVQNESELRAFGEL